MNADNHCNLTGTVLGEAWTRWRAAPDKRGQVRFWLAVPRDLAGEKPDILLCAIEPHSAGELRMYELNLRADRTVHLAAFARSLQPYETPREMTAVVIFVAESCGFDGAPASAVHHRHKLTGKLAAAGDHTLEPDFLEEISR